MNEGLLDCALHYTVYKSTALYTLKTILQDKQVANTNYRGKSKRPANETQPKTFPCQTEFPFKSLRSKLNCNKQD